MVITKELTHQKDMKKCLNVKKCLVCGKEFNSAPSSNRKFCSRSCYVVEWAKRMIPFKKDFPKGNVPWNKDKKLPYLPHLKMRGKRVSISTEFKYTNGSGWNVVLHNWVKKNLGKPNRCDICGTTENRVYHWSNISGEYKHELSDWQRCCVPCHKKYDLSRKKC